MVTDKFKLINRVLQKAKSISVLAHKYQHINEIANADDLKRVPTLTKYELLAAYPELSQHILQSKQRALVIATGGTTHEPITTFAPHHLFIKDITANWHPLEHHDIFANLLSAGRLWVGYTFFNLLSSHFAAITLPLGGLNKSDMDIWIAFLIKNRVTTLGINPSSLRILLDYLQDNKIAMPDIKKIIWGGEPFQDNLYELTQNLLPKVQLWGLYGSAEVFSIGNNTPNDPRDTFLIHDFQYIEIDNGRILSTNFHPDFPSIALRFEVGDCGELDESQHKLRLLNRKNHQMKMGMMFFSGNELIDLIQNIPGIENAQLAVFKSDLTGRDMLEVHILPKKNQSINAEKIKKEIISKSFLFNCNFNVDQVFKLYIVEELWRNPRTNKITIEAPAKGK